MAARISPETTEALRLIMKEGLTAYAAAQRTGISRSNISQNRTYRDFIEGKIDAEGNPVPAISPRPRKGRQPRA